LAAKEFYDDLLPKRMKRTFIDKMNVPPVEVILDDISAPTLGVKEACAYLVPL